MAIFLSDSLVFVLIKMILSESTNYAIFLFLKSFHFYYKYVLKWQPEKVIPVLPAACMAGLTVILCSKHTAGLAQVG